MDNPAIGLNGLDFDWFGQSYYFQAAYRFAPKWELMARYDAMYPNTNDMNGKTAQYSAAMAGIYLPAFSQFAKTLTVGLRYDISPWMMIRAEYNYVNGTAWLPSEGSLGPDGNVDSFKTVQYWDMFGFLVSLRF